MSASFTDEEFARYIQGLDFIDIEGLVGFIRPYVDELQKHLDAKDEPKFKKSYMRYSMIMAEFGVSLLNFAEAAVQQKDHMESLIKKMKEIEQKYVR